jgi:hypothetical protein
VSKVFVPGYDQTEQIKAFCKRNGLPTKRVNPAKWCSALAKVDLPETGGLLDEQRLKVFGAVLKS